MKRFVGYSALLLLLIVAVYGQTADFSFVRLDDHDYTFRCPFVMNGFSLANLKAAFLSVTHAAIWMPITYLTYMLDISLFGPGMGAHHVVNVVIHSINAILVFYFLLLLFNTREGQTPSTIDTQNRGVCVVGGQTLAIYFFAAAVWALHPLRCEGVAWIAGRKELLFTTFTLIGLIAWYKQRWMIGYVACALACMSKPTAMIFPLLAGVLEYCRGLSPVSTTHYPLPTNCRGLSPVLRYVPLLTMAVFTGILAIYSQTHPAGYEERALFAAPLWWRSLNAIVTLGLTVFQTVLPCGIHADYRSAWLGSVPQGSVPTNHFPLTTNHFPQGMWLGIAVLVLTVILGVIVWRRVSRENKKNLLFAIFWFLIGLIPVLGIYGSFGEHARADRFTYLPSIGFSILIVMAGISGFFGRFGRKLKCLVGVAVVLGLSVMASIVTNSWQNDATLFERVLKFDPDHGRALAHIGSDLCAKNRFDLGIGYFRKSMKLRPRNDTASQLAFALAMRGNSGDFEEIKQLCSFAVGGQTPSNNNAPGIENGVGGQTLSDSKGMALEALGMVAMGEKKYNRAIKLFDASLNAPKRFYPEEDTRLRRAICLMRLGRKEDARKELLPLANNARLGIRAAAIEYLRQLR